MEDFDIVLAIDPGRSKCGVALVNAMNIVLLKEIVETERLVSEVELLLGKYDISVVVMGDGTGCQTLQERIRERVSPMPLHLIDEDFTTLEARRLYFEDHPPRGLARLLPESMRCPSVPIDDYVAVLLAERYLDSLEQI